MATPEEIAREIAIRFEDYDMPAHPRTVWRHGLQDAIATALRAAEARGQEEMRERCAECIERDCHDDMTREEEAAAIRKLEPAP